MMSWSDEDRRRIAAEPYRRRHPMQVTGEAPLPYDGEPVVLPASGRPHDSITLQRNQDYPADSDLCFEVGTSETRVRVAPADKTALLGLLYSAAPTEESAALARKFLAGMLEETYRTEQLADGEIGPGPAARALERVIELLEQS